MTWAYDMAKLFKERENKEPTGPIVGKVLSVTPYKISINDDQIFLENEHLYIMNSLIGTLLVNDEVLLIPTTSEQLYFITGKVSKL
jgi:hypothetical protein